MTRIEYKKEERGKSFDKLRMTRIEYNKEERRKKKEASSSTSSG
jgi:hypothetical protein